MKLYMTKGEWRVQNAKAPLNGWLLCSFEFSHLHACWSRTDESWLQKVVKKRNIKLNVMEVVSTCVPTNSELTSKGSFKHTLYNPRLFLDTVNTSFRDFSIFYLLSLRLIHSNACMSLPFIAFIPDITKPYYERKASRETWWGRGVVGGSMRSYVISLCSTL